MDVNTCGQTADCCYVHADTRRTPGRIRTFTIVKQQVQGQLADHAGTRYKVVHVFQQMSSPCIVGKLLGGAVRMER